MKIGTAGSIVLTEEQKQELAELGHALSPARNWDLRK